MPDSLAVSPAVFLGDDARSYFTRSAFTAHCKVLPRNMVAYINAALGSTTGALKPHLVKDTRALEDLLGYHA